jgi:hypothetical protein
MTRHLIKDDRFDNPYRQLLTTNPGLAEGNPASLCNQKVMQYIETKL